MPTLRPAVPRALPSSSVLVCLGGLLLGGLVGAGCTPDSSGSPSPPDTTATVTQTATEDTSPSSSAPEPSPTPTSADRTVTQRLDDASVAARVKQALARNRSLRGFNFSPTVVHGHLVLRGDVDTRSQYRRAERAAAALRGVDKVTNRITVEGRRVSTGDNTTSDTAPTYHRVRGGDTLWHIAREYEVSVERIRALNDDLSSLQPGDRIRVQ